MIEYRVIRGQRRRDNQRRDFAGVRTGNDSLLLEKAVEDTAADKLFDFGFSERRRRIAVSAVVSGQFEGVEEPKAREPLSRWDAWQPPPRGAPENHPRGRGRLA